MNYAAGNRDAPRCRFVAHIHHVRLAAGIKMGECFFLRFAHKMTLKLTILGDLINSDVNLAPKVIII